MVVKDRFGRRRYIVFQITDGEDITKKDLIYTFNRVLPSGRNPEKPSKNEELEGTKSPFSEPKTLIPGNVKNNGEKVLRHSLKQFDGSFGVLLCPHWHQKEVLEILKSIERVGIREKPVKLESLGTSGTLKKARQKYIH